MRNKLEQITNLTINNLLNNKIILPSSYFEKFRCVDFMFYTLN